MPEAPVPRVAEVGLIDAIARYTKVENLDGRTERLFESMPPGVCVANFEAEGERIADESDPLAGRDPAP